MGTNKRKPNCQKLADRTSDLVKTVNQLTADIESDLTAPGEAAFHAKDAFAALQAAHLALLDAAREQTVRHYQGLADDARAAA